MTLGRFKGVMYKDIPKNYADWTVREMEANRRDNMHPDLHRFALWHQDRTKAASQGYLFRGDRVDKFEEEAKIPPPPVSETGSSASWTVIPEKDRPRQIPSRTPGITKRRTEAPSTSTPSTERSLLPNDADGDPTLPIPPRTTASTRRRADPTGPTTTRMGQDVPESVKKEIQDLETRLALLDAQDGFGITDPHLDNPDHLKLPDYTTGNYDEVNLLNSPSTSFA